MHIYLTSGTYDYLQKKYDEYNHTETILLLQDITRDQTILLHETNANSLFNEPRTYEIVLSKGSLQMEGYSTMNHIPVNDENKATFEHMIKKQINLQDASILSFRFLRPVKGDTYILFAQWKNKKTLIKWRQTQKNNQSPIVNTNTTTWNNPQHTMFNGKPYLLQLSIPEEE